jgi:type II secretory pathway pseudopilin PulG
MGRAWSLVEIAVTVSVLGTVLAAAVPAFVQNLHASKLSEPVEALARIQANAIAYAEGRAQEISFPPSVPLTPAAVPRGVTVVDPPDLWEHLTWKSLKFRMEGEHAFAFRYDSGFDAATGVMRFSAAAHGDLDGDGTTSSFSLEGERRPGQAAQAIPGMRIEQEFE